MGNCFSCCGKKSPCDHTEDETKGLLQSSESKISTRAGTDVCTSPSSDEEKRHEEQKKNQDEKTVIEPPKTEAETLKAQSSYSTMITMLSTDVSLAAEVNHNDVPEMPPKEALLSETTEHKKEATGETKNTAAEISDASPEPENGPLVKEVIADPSGSVEKDDVPAGDLTCSDSITIAVETSVLVEAEKNLLQPESEAQVEIEVKDAFNVGHGNSEDVSMLENLSCTRPQPCVVAPINESAGIEKCMTEVIAEDPIIEPTDEVEKSARSGGVEKQNLEMGEVFQSQELSKEGISAAVDSVPGFENGLGKDSGIQKSKDEMCVDVAVEEDVTVPLIKDGVLKSNKDPFETQSGLLRSPELTTQTESRVVDLDQPEEIEGLRDLEKSENVEEEEHKAPEPTQNGLDSTCTSELSNPHERASDVITPEGPQVVELSEAELLEDIIDVIETEEYINEEKENQPTTVSQENDQKGDISNSQKPEERSDTSGSPVKLMRDTDESLEKMEGALDERENLYLGAEDIEMGACNNKPAKPLLEFTVPGVERCSLSPAVDILAYSEGEWKGNTTRSALIRKGYNEISQSFSGLRRVRGDNYCALRATLYQILMTSTNIPTWIQDESFLLLPELIEAQENLIGGWLFPPECRLGCESDNSVEKLKTYLDLLKEKWQLAAACESLEEKQNVCEHVFQGGPEEYGLLEAIKFLMLAKALELHHSMVTDQEVPVFCWLLFARDTSENPQCLLANHLSQIGFSGGVEQVEMFLLGYALNHTIQAFRLYMIDTEEFVTHYPDDHKHEWPCVCIVTEDDRHYNVPVRKNLQHQHRDGQTTTSP